MKSGSMEAMNIQINCDSPNKREVTVDPKGKGPDSFNRMNSFEKKGQGEDWNRRGDRRGKDQNRGGFRNERGFGSREDVYHRGQQDGWGRGGKQQRMPRHGSDRTGQEGGQDRYRQDGGHRGDRGRRDSGGNKGDQRSRHGSGEHFRQDGGGHRGGWKQNRKNDRHEEEQYGGNRQDRRGSDYRERGGRREDDRFMKYSHDRNNDGLSEKGSENVEQDKHHQHGGGILLLPPKSRTPDPPHVDRQNHGGGNWGTEQGKNWGREQTGNKWVRESEGVKGTTRRQSDRHDSGGRQKTLFDPNNPSKPILIEEAKPKLDFKDPDSMYDSSPQSPSYPPNAQSPNLLSGHPLNPQHVYPAGTPNYGQMYPPGYGYGYGMPPPHLMGFPRGGMMPPPGPEGMYYGYPPHARDWNMYRDDPYYQG